jgi:hypothetical protein
MLDPPPAARIESDGVVRRYDGWSGRIFALVLLLLYVAAGSSAIDMALPYHDGAMRDVALALRGSLAVVALGVAVLLPIGFALLVWSWIAFARPGVITVSGAGLTIDRRGKREDIDPEDVYAADHDSARATLTLRVAGGEISARGVADAEAHALLRALAAGASDRALDLGLRRRATAARVVVAIVTMPVIAAAIGAASFTRSAAVVVATAATLTLAWAWLTMRFGSPTRLLVGHDGLALHGGGKTRFFAWAGVDDVSTDDDGIVLFPVGEPLIHVRLLAGRERYGAGLARLRRDHLVARIRDELGTRREASIEALGASHLDRGGRTVAEWRAALRSLVTRPSGSYRHSALDPEHLASALWSRDLTVERRLGAAMALAATDDPAARQRVRVFIDTCADDALRDAVERAAEGELDDAGLRRALLRIDRS